MILKSRKKKGPFYIRLVQDIRKFSLDFKKKLFKPSKPVVILSKHHF